MKKPPWKEGGPECIEPNSRDLYSTDAPDLQYPAPAAGVVFADVFSDGTWTPAPPGTGRRLLAMAVEVDGEIIDIVAWQPRRPDIWWLRLGVATILGADAIDASHWRGEPVVLHETPEDWVRARGEGAVILDWSIDLYPILSLAPSVKCSTNLLAARLRKALDRPRLRITVEGGHGRT